MSMMRCDYCDAYIDTDWDVEGEYEDASNKFRCSACCEEREETNTEAAS